MALQSEIAYNSIYASAPWSLKMEIDWNNINQILQNKPDGRSCSSNDLNKLYVLYNYFFDEEPEPGTDEALMFVKIGEFLQDYEEAQNVCVKPIVPK